MYTIDPDVVGVVLGTSGNHLDNQRNYLLLKEKGKGH